MKRILLSLFLLQCMSGIAQTPEFFNSFSTTFNNNFPLNTGSNNKAQWIFRPYEFNASGTGVGSPAYVGNISKVFIKLGASVSQNSYNNFTISLGQNVGTDTSFGTTPGSAYSFVTGLTPVFYQATGFKFTGGTAGSWYGITLPVSFPYDPSKSLIVEIKVSGGAGNNISTFATTSPRRMYGGYSSASATTATGVLNFGINMINTPLPVQLSKFTGEKSGSANKLSWTTQSETLNAGFTLYHSTDGFKFTELTRIQSKANQGNSAQELSYEYLHTQPRTGHNYYKLEQTDIDGTSRQVAQIIDLYHESSQLVNLYPNPASHNVWIETELPLTASMGILVFDIRGQLMLRQDSGVQSGLHRIPMDISKLPTGTYLVQIQLDDQPFWSTTLSKQN